MAGRRFRTTPRSLVFLLGGVLAITLAACSGGTAQSATEVHEAFLTALRTNDREGVLALTVADQQALRADSWLGMMQPYLFSTSTEGPYATGGLTDVQAVRIEDRGTGKRAWSRWQYVKTTTCHITDLSTTPDGWRVVDYNLTNPDQCSS